MVKNREEEEKKKMEEQEFENLDEFDPTEALANAYLEEMDEDLREAELADEEKEEQEREEQDTEELEESEDEDKEMDTGDNEEAQEEDNEEETSQDSQEADREKQKAEKKVWKLKYKGKELEIDDENELIRLAQMGFDYGVKMSKVKQMSSDALLLEKAKQGDKRALRTLLDKVALSNKYNSIEDLVVDLEDEPLYEEKDLEQEARQRSLWDNIQEMVTSDPYSRKIAERIRDEIIPELPSSMVNLMKQDPYLYEAVFEEVQSGWYDKIKPLMDKELLKLSPFERISIMEDPRAYIQFYNNIRQKLAGMSSTSQKEQKTTTQEQEKEKTQKKPKKYLSSKATRQEADADEEEAERIWNDDEYFMKKYREVMGYG